MTSACPWPAALIFPLPFAMVRPSSRPSYCSTALRGGTCTDNKCSKLHDLIRCEPCNCSFPPPSLQEHQNGRQHLRNALNRPQPSPLTPAIQSALPANILPPTGGTSTVSTCDTDPRVEVSSEDGLDFFAEGSGTSTNPSFSSTNHNILIEKTNMSSCLSLQSVTLRPFLGSWCEKSGHAIHRSHNLSTASQHL